MKETIRPDGRPPTPGFAPGIKSGNLVFISGQVAKDEAGHTVGIGDPLRQAEQVFANIGRILAAAGATYEDILKITVFLTDRAHYPAFAEVRNRYLNPNHASTLVYVSGLVNAEWLIEVEAVAHCGKGG